MELLLDEISQDFPAELFERLNGGILILPEAKLHEKNKNGDLFIMGEYHYDRALGRYIVIYYGSFARIYGSLSREALKARLTATLKHEFLHHVESLAGERGLEIKDADDLSDYLRRGKPGMFP
ncbi:MAG: metallopeptidase family protein [Saccharofermentanales bacterium]